MVKHDRKAYQAAYYARNRERLKARHLAYYFANRERIRVWKSKYSRRNKLELKMKNQTGWPMAKIRAELAKRAET